MARVTAETVEHVARLARLSLTDEERALLARELDAILAYAESIQALDVAGVAPMSHAQLAGRFRDDTPAPGLDRERALAAAPDPDSGLYRVPRILAG
jgi:aspartyl-tRNA(Asn)/glutamyl-tRNA(Gln) amidotransferase subunit C